MFVSDEALASNLKPLFLDMRGAHWTNFDDYALKKFSKTVCALGIWLFVTVRFKEAIKYVNEVGSSNIENYIINFSTKLR